MPITACAGLRILVLTTTFPASPGDGTPEFVLTLSSEFARRGAAVTVVAPMVRGAARRERFADVDIRRFRYFPRRWEDVADGAILPNLRTAPSRWLQVPPLLISMLWAARQAARETSAEIVHAHWLVPSGLVARLLGSPYIVTAHGGDAYALRGLAGRLVKLVASKAAGAVVPVSASIADELAPLRLQSLVEPVPMGVDVASVRAVAGERRPEPDRLLFVGRLVEKKGVDDLLQAVRLLPRVRLRIVGEGPMGNELKQMAEMQGLDDRVSFLGRLPSALVFREMAAAALIVIPSRKAGDGDEDGVPVVMAEAMAIGVPIVATTAGGLNDFIEDGVAGWTVNQRDPAALANAIEDALSRPGEAEHRAQMAWTHHANELSIMAVGSRYEEILKRALMREAL